MLKKAITYTDFNNVTVTEDFYFNLSKSEIAEIELSHEGGFEEHLKKIVAAKDVKEVIGLFKRIVRLSIGQRSEDGKRFIKTEEIKDAFEQSPAYDELFMELITDAEKSAEFVSGIVPQDLAAKIPKEIAVTDNEGPKELSDEELLKLDPKQMTHEQLQRAFALRAQS